MKGTGTDMRSLRFIYQAFVVTFLLAWPAIAAEPSINSLPGLIEEYVADHEDVSNTYPLPGSDTRRTRLEALSRQWLDRLALLPFDTLSQAAKVDYLLLQNDLQHELSTLALERKQWAEIHELIAFRGIIYSLEENRLKGLPVDSKTAADQMECLSKQIKEIRERVEQGLKTNAATVVTNTSSAVTNSPAIKTNPILAKRSAGAVDRLRESLKSWFSAYNGYLPEFAWWVKTPYEEADKALGDYSKLLREEIAGLKGKNEDPIVGEPLGDTSLGEAIQREFIAYDADALLAIARQEMAWCEHELIAASRDMGCGDDWKAALAKVKADYVPPGEQDILINDIAREAITFTKAHKLATVPALCEEAWHLTMMSPDTLKTIPYAAYNGQAMMVAYARDSMPHEDKLMTMRGNNRHFVHNVTPHELIPGHHLQRYQAARHNRQRAYFSTPFHVEGWALYMERCLWDLGWARTPEDRIGMLFWRMTRAARVEVSLQFHRGKMTPSEIVDFLVNRVGHERLAATSEARRLMDNGFSPLYQASYLLGSLQFDALRREVVEKRHLMTLSEFHDTVLAMNAIPIELVRAELLALPLSRDYHPCWRFAGNATEP